MSKFPSRVSVSAEPDRGVTGAFEITMESENGKKLLHSKKQGGGPIWNDEHKLRMLCKEISAELGLE
eukprot:jgi/Tetstr1/441911/TSEL_030119.t1